MADSPFFKFTFCGCETCCGCVLSHHLSSTWRACYSLFWLVANGVRCIFKLISGYPAFLCPIGKILFSPVCKCVCGLKFWVSKRIPVQTLSRMSWSMHSLRYVNFKEHIIWRFSWKEGGRGYLLGVTFSEKGPRSEGLLILGVCLFHWDLMCWKKFSSIPSAFMIDIFGM